MNAATVIPSLPCDAAIPDVAVGAFAPTHPFGEVLFQWRAQIDAERLIDHAVNYRELSMREIDGALVRKSALAYTRHGSGQLLNLLVTNKPNNLNNCLRWIKPTQRAAVFNVDVRDNSNRDPADLVVLRTLLIQVKGIPVRAIRAAVSTRHSLKAMDDRALSGALEQEINGQALASVTRNVDTTHGFAIVGEPHPHLTRTIHWRNSETGIASMSFGAGAWITVVDAPARFGQTQDVDAEMSDRQLAQTEAGSAVRVANDQSGSRVRHTSPGGKAGDEAAKLEIATGRMRNAIRKALAGGEQLKDAWEKAMASRCPNFQARPIPLVMREMDWAVLFDAAEERMGFVGNDRTALLAIMQNDRSPGFAAPGICSALRCCLRDAGEVGWRLRRIGAPAGSRWSVADEALGLKHCRQPPISNRRNPAALQLPQRRIDDALPRHQPAARRTADRLRARLRRRRVLRRRSG